MESPSLQQAKEQLLELRQSLHQVCKDVEERLRTLEGYEIESKVEKTQDVTAAGEGEQAESYYAAPMETRMVMEATSPSVMSADLEQTTLEELNSALAKAFAQMAGRMVW